MKKVLIGFLSGLVLVTVPAHAQHSDRSNYNHGHRHGDRNRWIIPAIIGGAVVYAATRPVEYERVPVYVPPQQPSYPAQTCVTRETFDQYGRRVSSERTCY